MNTDESDSPTPPNALPTASKASLNPRITLSLSARKPPIKPPITVPIPGAMIVPIAAPIAEPPADARPSEMASSGDLPSTIPIIVLMTPPMAPILRPDFNPADIAPLIPRPPAMFFNLPPFSPNFAIFAALSACSLLTSPRKKSPTPFNAPRIPAPAFAACDF